MTTPPDGAAFLRQLKAAGASLTQASRILHGVAELHIALGMKSLGSARTALAQHAVRYLLATLPDIEESPCALCGAPEPSTDKVSP